MHHNYSTSCKTLYALRLSLLRCIRGRPPSHPVIIAVTSTRSTGDISWTIVMQLGDIVIALKFKMSESRHSQKQDFKHTDELPPILLHVIQVDCVT